MKSYDPRNIEPKWQKFWEKEKIFEAKDNSEKPKFYILDMFPYPSGAGLHVGHPRGYIGTDVIAHYMRMRRYNVLHPMGWDAFGLPAENYAIKTGIHPEITTKQNIKRFKEQMKRIGLSYDWSREISTADPEYYKWTQWIFLKLFERGLAYRANLPINWCPSCKTGLANEEVVDGKCERCQAAVVKKKIGQWVLKITDYAEKLLQGLDELDWPEQIKEMQRNWIGRSEGAIIKFQIINSKAKTNYKSQIENSKEFIKAFTTRPETIFGATFLVLAPEHEFAASLFKNPKSKIQNIEEIKEYIKKAKKKTERKRIAGIKDKTGVEIIGIKAINPADQKKIPIYIADYVLSSYGYGAIMGVPAHDKRDYEFAKKYNREIIEVIRPSKFQIQNSKKNNGAYEGEGILIKSGNFDGIKSEKAKKEITRWLAEKNLAKAAVNYKLRDWIFSRQRYWGEPMPLVFCPACKKQLENSKSEIKNQKQIQNSKFKIQNLEFHLGELLNPGWVALPEKELPLELPRVEKYQPTGTGESPLSAVKNWKETKCPKCNGKAIRETNTMPQWAGSCWYFIAYCVSSNPKSEIQNPKLLEYWLPVDFYVGGAEHAVLHLLYARFWIKALYDSKIVSFKEPFSKLKTIGLILAPDGQKMSKSRGNVINPDEIIEKYGADTFRIYEMFMGPFDQPIAWDSQGILGAQRFLQKIWRLREKFKTQSAKRKTTTQNSKINKLVHKTIKKVTEDIEAQKFNTAIAAMMELVNEMEKEKELSVADCELLVRLLAPFAPHISEELHQLLGKSQITNSKSQTNPKSQIPNPKQIKSVFEESWPEYDQELIENEKVVLAAQVNGRVRDQIEILAGISEKEAQKIALKSPKIQKWLNKKEIKKTIFIKDKVINFVV